MTNKIDLLTLVESVLQGNVSANAAFEMMSNFFLFQTEVTLEDDEPPYNELKELLERAIKELGGNPSAENCHAGGIVSALIWVGRIFADKINAEQANRKK